MEKVALDIENLCKIYPKNFKALDQVSLKVNAGDFYALLGPNGAGKSTLIGIISSLVNKSNGKVEILGIDIDKNHSLACLLYTSPSPRDGLLSRMPSSA